MSARLPRRMMVAVLVVGCATSAILLADEAHRAKVALPSKVVVLAAWPSTEQRAGKVIDAGVSIDTRRAANGAVQWIRKVIDDEWLPENAEETLGSKVILLEKVYPSLDTCHVEWEKNGYRFRASQTSTVFYLNVTAAGGKISEANETAMRTTVRDLASKLFRDIGEVRETNGFEIAEGGTKDILIRNSFDLGTVQQLGDGIMGQPADWDPDDKLDRARFSRWWRRVGWTTDGHVLALFTLKTDGGSWWPNYQSQRDGEWFNPKKYR